MWAPFGTQHHVNVVVQRQLYRREIPLKLSPHNRPLLRSTGMSFMGTLNDTTTNQMLYEYTTPALQPGLNSVLLIEPAG